jgi:hypothetical protein
MIDELSWLDIQAVLNDEVFAGLPLSLRNLTTCILYGSRAVEGLANPQSDVDLIIVVDNPPVANPSTWLYEFAGYVKVSLRAELVEAKCLSSEGVLSYVRSGPLTTCSGLHRGHRVLFSRNGEAESVIKTAALRMRDEVLTLESSLLHIDLGLKISMLRLYTFDQMRLLQAPRCQSNPILLFSRLNEFLKTFLAHFVLICMARQKQASPALSIEIDELVTLRMFMEPGGARYLDPSKFILPSCLAEAISVCNSVINRREIGTLTLEISKALNQLFIHQFGQSLTLEGEEHLVARLH